MKKELKQLTFGKGMIENLKQDLPNQVNPVFESALWLENINPNVQKEAAVLRGSQSPLYHTLGVTNILVVPRYSKYAELSLGIYSPGIEGHERLRENIVAQTSYFQSALPHFNDNYIAFVRRYPYMTPGADPDFSPHGSFVAEATAVVAWVPYIDAGGAKAVGWREPFYDAEDYPGWYALGTYQDHARYGESIIFVTYPLYDMADDGSSVLLGNSPNELTDAAKQKHYPCYIWQWWDLSKKRDGLNGSQKFWNGLTLDLTDPKYRLWKIRKPSLSIVKEELVEALALWKHPDTWKGFDGADPLGKPIQLLFWESPLRTYNKISDLTTFSEKVVAQDIFDLPELYTNPFFDNALIPSVESLETIDIESLYTFGYNGHVRRAKQSDDYYGIFFNGEDLVPFPKKTSAGYVDNPPTWSIGTGFYYKRDKYTVESATESKIMDLVLCLTENRSNPDGDATIDNQYIGIVADGKMVDPYSDQAGIGDFNGTTNHDDEGARGEAFVVGTRLPNYLEASIPRQWIQSEAIPFLLTATVNGVEVAILKDIYKVATHNYALTESLFCPILWDNIPGDELVDDDVAIFGNGYEISITTFDDGSPANPPPPGILDAPYKAMKRILSNIDEARTAQYWMKVDHRYDMFVASKARNLYVSRKMINVPTYNGFAWVKDDGIVSTNRVHMVLPDRIRHYMYEPFNPTSELTYRYSGQSPAQYRMTDPNILIERDTTLTAWSDSSRNSAEHWAWNLVTGDISGSGLYTPYCPEICEGNMVHVSIRIDRTLWADISSMNISAFNLYVSKPDLQSSILRSIGIIQPQEVPNGLYCKPKVTKDNIKASNDFALVKTWLVEGEGSPVTHWKHYNGMPLATNSWYDDTTDYIWAVPQDSDGSNRTLPDFIDHCTEYPGNDESNSWTPDFILWDYPTKGKTLSLGSSGEYYTGIGAKHIAVIKGRTFIDDPEDIGVVHYSDVQAGVAAQDIFSIEHKMRIGHNAFTAFVEYREQLWFFSRYDNYRLQMPNVYDESTWEFLDTVAMGTFHKKTVAVTPYGVVYANEAGVWISDGRMPTNLAQNVLHSYQYLVRDNDDSNRNPRFYAEVAYLGDYSLEDGTILKPLNGIESAVNDHLELVYDTLKDEINICTPLWLNSEGLNIAKREYRLIYNFPNQNWRVEAYDLPQTRPGVE